VSPAGYSDQNEPATKRLVLQPEITKTLIKGIIPLAILSLFLNIAPNLGNYFIFVALWFGVLGLYMLVKRNSKFMIGEDDIMVKRVLGKSKTISYRDILDMSVSQGILAKKFKCGSVYLILRQGKGGVNLMGGGNAERLDDVPSPEYVYDLISSKLGPFSAPP
jgi:uncharacterized membrane protein YdbT with pleckstrin-like domain